MLCGGGGKQGGKMVREGEGTHFQSEIGKISLQGNIWVKTWNQ